MRARDTGADGLGTTRVWDEIGARLRALMGDEHVRVGVFADADKAAVHEFGSEDGTIPERSYIRKTLEHEAAGELKDITAKLAKAVIMARMPGDKALGILGEWASARIKKTIVDQPSDWPPLVGTPQEIAARKGPGKHKTLIDTGELLNSITYEVKA